MVDGRVVLVDGLLHEAQAEHARVEVDVAGGVAGDGRDVVDPLEPHAPETTAAGTLRTADKAARRAADLVPMAAKSWLCRDDMDRERLLDMERRLGPVRRASIGVIALALVACGPWLGWWTLIPLAVAAAASSSSPSGARRAAARPEYLLFGAWTLSEIAIAGAVALTGDVETPTLAWLAIPVVTLSARFSARGVALGVGVALVLVFAVAFGTDADAIVDNPVLLARAADARSSARRSCPRR